MQCAQQQRFQIGKCLYQLVEQQRLIAQIVEAIEALAERYDAADHTNRPLAQAYYGIFERIESDLLRIAALLKHPSFQEEEEWRIVSPVLTNYVASPVLFREGTSMLVPYLEFCLQFPDGEPITLEHLYLGPTPNISLSMNSLAMFLAKRGIRPRQGISYCQIPYRQW